MQSEKFSYDHFENDFQMDLEGSDEEDHLDNFDAFILSDKTGEDI